jgi:ssDNA-binding Zn-finger/Zn-ribbon topoisomerase 1
MGITIRENVLDCPHCGHKSDLDYAINIFDRTEDEQERANGKCDGCERRLVFRRTAKGFIKVYKAKSTDPEYGEERVRSGFIEHRLDCPKCGITNNADDLDKLFSRSKNIDCILTQCDGCNDKLIVRRNANGFYNLYVYYYNYNVKKRR